MGAPHPTRISASSFSAIALGIIGGLSACSSPPEYGEETAATSRAAIVDAKPATDYPEAAVIDMYVTGTSTVGGCAGSLIAPRVALVAGHCVLGFDEWRVLLPYNGGQQAKTTSAAVYDYRSLYQGGTLNPDPSTHDLGLIFLDSPLHVSSDQCPVLASAPAANGSRVVNLGIRDNGAMWSPTASDVYVSPSVAISDATSQGYPTAYYSAQVDVEPGDSGGPDEVPGSSPHQIVAVNSAIENPGALFARVDLLHAWITEQIQSHGGACDTSQAGGKDAGGNGSGRSVGEAGDDDAAEGGDGTSPAAWNASSRGCDVSGAIGSPREALALICFGLGFLVRVRRRSRGTHFSTGGGAMGDRLSPPGYW